MKNKDFQKLLAEMLSVRHDHGVATAERYACYLVSLGDLTAAQVGEAPLSRGSGPRRTSGDSALPRQLSDDQIKKAYEQGVRLANEIRDSVRGVVQVDQKLLGCNVEHGSKGNQGETGEASPVGSSPTGPTSPTLSVEEVREQLHEIEQPIPFARYIDYADLYGKTLDAIADGHPQARELAAAARGRSK